MSLSLRFVRYFSSWRPKWSPESLLSRQLGGDPSVLKFSQLNDRSQNLETYDNKETEEEEEAGEDKKSDKPATPLFSSPPKTLVAFITKTQLEKQHDALRSSGLLSLDSLSQKSSSSPSSALQIPIDIAALNNFGRKGNSTAFVYPKTKTAWDRILLVNLDEKFYGNPESKNSNKSNNLDDATQALRDATHLTLSSLKSSKSSSATILLPSIPKSGETKLTQDLVLDTFCKTAILSNHSFSKYLKKKGSPVYELGFLDEGKVWSKEKFNSLITKATVYGEGTVLVRELGNDRADKITPSYMELLAKQLATTHQTVQMRVLNSADLIKENCHLFQAVGQGAEDPPRLVLLEYKGDPKSEERIALVGKGITFDTGGLNLKPTGAMEDMHLDMSGSAIVLSTIKAAALLKLPLNLVGALALAENAIGPKAYKPHTIIQSRKGTTVEVSNTDAEGRLVLADTLHYIQDTTKGKRPHTIIDVATLTGACVHALGEYASGLFSNNDNLADELVKAGRSTFERTWRLPIFPEHIEDLNGTYSDIRSTGKSKTGGASTAAAFLQHFIEKDVAWAHLDIAGPAMYSSTRKWMPTGGTGYGVQLLLTFLEK